MPTVKCRDCDHMVSPTAEVCPSCGARFPGSSSVPKIAIHRKPSITAYGLGMIITLDGRVVAELVNDASIEQELPIGKHVLDVRPRVGFLGGGSTTFNIEPTKNLRIDVSFGVFGAQFTVSPMER